MHTQSPTGCPGTGDCKVSVVMKLDSETLAAAYRLSPEQAGFFKRETGIDGDDDLRMHILNVQQIAYETFPYTCIRSFMFLRLGIAQQPEYKQVIKLGRERPDGILLDIGCCFGADARKAVADGFPLKNVVTTDLRKEFFDLGHILFKTTPETYPIGFLPGDAFDPHMLQIVPPSDVLPSEMDRPDLSTLTSLNPLAGHCAVIYAGNFFHLFSEERQLHLAKALGGLLSSEPGSMICGEHVGNRQKGLYHLETLGRQIDMFQHSPESWRAMWDEVFAKGSVRVEAKLEHVEFIAAPPYFWLQWSVVRL